MTYISSQSLTTPMRQSVQQIQSSMAQTQAEISANGKVSDIGLTLGASTGTALSLQNEVDHMTSFKNTNTLATARLAATSDTLTSMVASAQNISQDLTEATGVGTTSTLQTSAQDALQALVGNLNTSSGGQFIFGGINSGAQPITTSAPTDLPATAVTAFQTYLSSIPTTASAITGAQMQTFLDGDFTTQFQDSAWTDPTTGTSKASNTTISTNILPSQSLKTSVSANDASIRQITQAYTMLSAFTGTSSGLSAGAISAVVASAAKLMSSGSAGLNNVTAGVGIAQSAVDNANTQIDSQVNVLTSNVDSLENVDVTTLSTTITQLQNQLTASFSLTNKLSQLSLVNYLTS